MIRAVGEESIIGLAVPCRLRNGCTYWLSPCAALPSCGSLCRLMPYALMIKFCR